MTLLYPQSIYQNLYDCLSDPGELGVIDAIRAAEIHSDCSERCHPRQRAQQAIASAGPGRLAVRAADPEPEVHGP
ncbi:hypothetical protein [Nocardia goodfellowii]|uniref:Zinc-finger domain-containing protein n=1 Tax=Nocardia goodfellowii TaxID=882446 RepID=A0ABS4QLK9_9NOCA|nr:hypothetical protein [Nocardia goodfellowii]MBP2192589.1 hypothetical protein [Nocardia goodfellowii]